MLLARFPSSRASYDVFDASVTAPRREAALSEAAHDSVLLAAQEAPSVLLRAAYGQSVSTCQVLGPINVLCDDGCWLPRGDKVSGMMREACTREQLLGPVRLAQWHVGRARVEAEVCFVMATCACLAPCTGMCVLRPAEEQLSAR